MPEETTVLVVDDQPAVREAVTAALSATGWIRVVAQNAGEPEALDKVAELSPDVVVLDLRMPTIDGLSMLGAIKAGFPDTKVLILSALSERQCVREVFNLGAAGYAVKAQGEMTLADIVARVARGETYVHPAVRGALMSQLAWGAAEGLSDEDQALLALLAEGATDEEIAERTGAGVEQVAADVRRVLSDIEFTERSQRVAAAVRAREPRAG